MSRQEVVSARYESDAWQVQTQDQLYNATNLVIAAGYNHEPFLPTWPGKDLFRGTVMHSSQFKNGEAFRGKNVLVVGFGNSDGEVAIDLWKLRGSVQVLQRRISNPYRTEPVLDSLKNFGFQTSSESFQICTPVLVSLRIEWNYQKIFSAATEPGFITLFAISMQSTGVIVLKGTSCKVT